MKNEKSKKVNAVLAYPILKKTVDFRYHVKKYGDYNGCLTENDTDLFYVLDSVTFNAIVDTRTLIHKNFNCGDNWSMGNKVDFFRYLKSDRQMLYYSADYQSSTLGDKDVFDFSEVKTVEQTETALARLDKIFKYDNPVICDFPYSKDIFLKMFVSLVLTEIERNLGTNSASLNFKRCNAILKIISHEIPYHNVSGKVGIDLSVKIHDLIINYFEHKLGKGSSSFKDISFAYTDIDGGDALSQLHRFTFAVQSMMDIIVSTDGNKQLDLTNYA